MTRETEASVISPEYSSTLKRIFKELRDNPIAGRFNFDMRFFGIDKELHCRGDRNNFSVDLKRSFNQDYRQYIFEKGQLSSVVMAVNPLPGTPFSHKEQVRFNPQEINVTEEDVLNLIKMVKKEEEFLKKKPAYHS